MSKVENAAKFMENIAADNSHGYDQLKRWGSPDYDCSSLVISAYEQAGVKVKTAGATYTGNMYNVFLKCGFKDVTSSVNRSTGAGLKRGDVLLNNSHHTAMALGSGKLAEAAINEKGGIYGGTPGDQTGQEIRTRSYYNYPWDCVLRYPETADSATAATTTTAKSVETIALEVLDGKWGNGDVRKQKLTAAGYSYTAVQAKVNELLKSQNITKIAKEVIAGKWGNGTDRARRLAAAGYDYTEVQREVNRLLK